MPLSLSPSTTVITTDNLGADGPGHFTLVRQLALDYEYNSREPLLAAARGSSAFAGYHATSGTNAVERYHTHLWRVVLSPAATFEPLGLDVLQ